jgi:hypothetical protein
VGVLADGHTEGAGEAEISQLHVELCFSEYDSKKIRVEGGGS